VFTRLSTASETHLNQTGGLIAGEKIAAFGIGKRRSLAPSKRLRRRIAAEQIVMPGGSVIRTAFVRWSF
jgi:hypothetical protein